MNLIVLINLCLALYSRTHDNENNVLWKNGIGKYQNATSISFYDDNDSTKFFLQKKKYFRTAYIRDANNNFSVEFLDKNNNKMALDEIRQRIFNATAEYYFTACEKKFNGEMQ